jgi:hypothetical protein
MRAQGRARLAALVHGGVVLAFVGGLLLSNNRRCTDSPAGRGCFVTFSSHAWHDIGLAAVTAGLVVILAAVAMVASAWRQKHSNAHSTSLNERPR